MDPVRLQAAASALGVCLDSTQADRLIRYVALLERWNGRFNLISRQDIGRVWPRHILDSLSIAPVLAAELSPTDASSEEAERMVLDIGTGAGLPGLPLSIALPETRWRLIDRNQRKVRFLETVISQLGLENVTADAMDLAGNRASRGSEGLFGAADAVVSRAVDVPAGLLPLAAPLLKPTGRLVLMTAAVSRESDAQAGESALQGVDASDRLPPGSGFVVTDVLELSVPGLDRTHEVTIIKRAAETETSADGQ